MSVEPVFVDTNVFLYARDATEPEKNSRACVWLEALWRSGRGRTSVQVLNEYYVNITQKLPGKLLVEAAREDLRDLGAWQPTPITSELVGRAFEVEDRFRFSWWDSLIVAAALASGCRWLLSEDLRHGQALWNMRVCSPFEVAPGDLR